MQKRSPLLLGALCLALLCGFALLRSLRSPDSSSQDAPDGANPSKPLAAFETWLENAPANLDEPLLRQGLRLAERRRARMLQLLETDPEAALASALSYAEYERLPAEIQALVERPFSQTANFDLIVVCDHDPNSPEFLARIRLAQGEVLQLSASHPLRFPTSKRSAPLQGIALDGLAAVRPQILQPLENEDRSWALQNLPAANTDPGLDFHTGEAISGEAIVAISGGFAFHFASEDSLARFEQELAAIDELPGRDVGSSALIRQLASYANGPFPLQQFAAQQKEVSLLAALETKQFLIIRVSFANHPETPFAADELENMVNNFVAPALADYSYNKTTVAVTVTPEVYALNSSDSYGNQDQIHDAAVSAYTLDGHLDPFLEYDIVSVSFPQIGFGWAGLASLGGADQWLHGRVQSDTILHELGHNYGLAHANYWIHDSSNANSLDPVDATGANDEYGDSYDVMGSGSVATGHFHMAAKQYLNWIDSQQWQDLADSGDNGTYRIYQFDEVSATGLQALRVSKTASSDQYWIGYRKSLSSVPNFDQGAYLIWERGEGEPARNQSWLIDTTPHSSDGKFDAGIPLGRTYSDPASQLHITPVAVGENDTGRYLDVQVNFGSFPNNQAPSGTLAAAETGEARSPVSFAYTGSDPDGDALAYHWDFGDGTVDQNAAALDHQFPVGGAYTVTLTVSDMKGGTQTLTADITVSDPITEIQDRSGVTSNTLYSLAANDERVVAGGSGGTFLSSTDGQNWTRHFLASNRINLHILDIFWTGSQFIAVGNDYDSGGGNWAGAIYESADGINWSSALLAPTNAEASRLLGVAYDPASDITVVSRDDFRIFRRQGNEAWTEVDLQLPDAATSTVSTRTSVIWTGSEFILGGYSFDNTADRQLILQRSADGSTWQDIAADSGMLDWHGFEELALLNGSLLGSGFFSDIRYSLDGGETWQTNSQNLTLQANSFAYGNGIYSASGSIVEINEPEVPQDFLSTDGRNWKAIGAPPDGVVYNDRIFFVDTFISVGDNGLIHQSSPFEAPEESPFAAWIVGYISDSANQGALSNPDFDWAPNFMEFALGSDPSDPDSAPTPPQLSRNAENKLIVDVARYAKTDVALTLEVSSNLVEWSPLGAATTVDSETALQLTSLTTFDNFQAIFVRVKASQ